MKLTIVGIGPGNKENMTLLAHRALEEAQVIVGYPVYVNLIKDNYPGREFLTTGMTHETERCRMALEEARKGRKVAMVSTNIDQATPRLNVFDDCVHSLVHANLLKNKSRNKSGFQQC